MDLELVKRCWREDMESSLPPLKEETVMRMLTNRAADLRRQVRGRLRQEAVVLRNAHRGVGGEPRKWIHAQPGVGRLHRCADDWSGHGDALVGPAPHR